MLCSLSLISVISSIYARNSFDDKNVRRSFNSCTEDVAKSWVCMNLNKSDSSSDTLEVTINPDFFYLVEVSSTCGANTMFTKGEDLDYRPGGGIITYNSSSKNGKILLFKTNEDYDADSFVKSVKSNKDWNEFPEAQKQIEYLEKRL